MTTELEPLTDSGYQGLMDTRVASALERIATALEQLVLERIPNVKAAGTVEPPYVTLGPPETPHIAVPAQGNIPPAPAQRQPDDPNRPPTHPCQVHGWTWKWVPPGTSRKTGQPYNGFWACNTRGCDQRP